jgi:hypothetical protein
MLSVRFGKTTRITCPQPSSTTPLEQVRELLEYDLTIGRQDFDPNLTYSLYRKEKRKDVLVAQFSGLQILDTQKQTS